MYVNPLEIVGISAPGQNPGNRSRNQDFLIQLRTPSFESGFPDFESGNPDLNQGILIQTRLVQEALRGHRKCI